MQAQSFCACIYGDKKMKGEITAEDIVEALRVYADNGQRNVLMRFFKTGKGEYGEGDSFLGVRVPQTRSVVREARGRVSMGEIERLLYSPLHEARLAALLLLVEEMKAALPRRRSPAAVHASLREEIVRFYLRHARQANNWDLVDLSCEHILGAYLLHPRVDGRLPDRSVLDRLAASDNLWEQRIAIVSTLELIRDGQFDDTLRISTLLLDHPHDLIHKAVGWMLREVGKRDKDVLTDYLEANYARMTRTTLRYAIERFHEDERRRWLNRR